MISNTIFIIQFTVKETIKDDINIRTENAKYWYDVWQESMLDAIFINFHLISISNSQVAFK